MSTTPDAAGKRRHRNERLVAVSIILLAIVATAVLLIWGRRLELDANDRSYIPKPETRTPEIDLLAEFVRIDSSTPEGAAEAAQWVVRQLRAAGIEPRVIESAPGRPNVYARIRGRQPGNALLLFNHVDVFRPWGEWDHPPFAAEIALNQLWGRGVLDMKALVLCQLLAFTDLARSGRTPQHDLVFISTPDEETGSEFGMQWLVRNRPELFEGVRYAITEGGVTEMLTDRITYFGIEIGGKHLLELLLEGESLEQMRRMRFALQPHIASKNVDRVLPEVRRYFATIAPTRLVFRKYLADIDSTVRDGQLWRLPPSYRDLLQNSLWVSAPFEEKGRWKLRVKMLNLPGSEPQTRVAWLETQIAPFGVKVGEIVTMEHPTRLSSDQTPLFRMLVEEAGTRYGSPAGSQVLYKTATDCRFLRPIGIACYGVSPYPVNIFQSVTIHDRNERIQLDYFHEGIAFMRSVVGRWAAAEQAAR